MKPTRRKIAAMACAGWAAAIFLTSSTVITPGEFFDWLHKNVFPNDALFERFQIFWAASWLVIVKGWHFTEFAILMLLLTWTVDEATDRHRQGNVLVAAIVCILFAATDEWHQTFVPQRGGLVSDVLIDSAGVLTVAILLIRRRRPDT